MDTNFELIGAFIALIGSSAGVSIMVASFIVGNLLKSSVISNRLIPWIVTLLGCVLGFIFLGATKEAVLTGFILSGISIVFYDLFKVFYELLAKKMTLYDLISPENKPTKTNNTIDSLPLKTKE